MGQFDREAVLKEKGNEKSSFSKAEGYEQLVNVLMDLFIAGTSPATQRSNLQLVKS